MTEQRKVAYRSNAGALIVVLNDSIETGVYFSRDERTFYKVQTSDISAHAFDAAIPQLNMSGRAEIRNGNIIWRGWQYNYQHRSFMGELTLAQEYAKDRIGRYLFVGKGDGYVIYVSVGASHSPSDYRLFAARVSEEGGVLPRIDVRECMPMRNGSTIITTAIGEVNTAAASWRVLTIGDYNIVETVTEVRFTRKR